MRRIIVHLIRGEAGEVHINLTKDLAKKFEGFPFHNHIPPHLTLKRYFEIDEIDVENLFQKLDGFASSLKQSHYLLSGLGHFGKDVIYVDVKPSLEMKQDVSKLLGILHTVNGIQFDEYDNADNFHASLAISAHRPFDYDKFWEYLSSIKPLDFKMNFDNISVLKRGKDRWEIERVFEIRP